MSEQLETVVNIGARERLKRFLMGIFMLLIGVGLVVTLIVIGAIPWVRLVAFLPFFGGTLGVFQARARIGVDLADRGVRDLGAGQEEIESHSEMVEIRNQALKVYVESLLAAAALTIFCLLIPY